MGNSPSSASGDEPNHGLGSEEAQAAKRNRRLQRHQEKQAKFKSGTTGPNDPSGQYKQPSLHPIAAKVVRPQVDSQVVYNHGRVGIHGIGHEHQNFPCICREIAEVRGEQLKLLQLQKQQATDEAVAEFKAAVKQNQHQKFQNQDEFAAITASPNILQQPTAGALAAMKELQVQPKQFVKSQPPSTATTPSASAAPSPQQLRGITASGQQVVITPGATPPLTPTSTPTDPTKLKGFGAAAPFLSPNAPLTNHTPKVLSVNPNIPTGVTPTNVGTTGQQQTTLNPTNAVALGESLLRKSPVHPLMTTGRCVVCGGIIEDFNEATIPSCSWIDGTVMAGSLITSMVAAQRNFSESLRQVQNEDQPLVMLSNLTGFDMPTVRALQEVFTKIGDQEGKDNLISAQELCSATGVPPESILGKAMFRLMDITRSNNVNFRTWIVMLSKLSPHASLEDKIQFAFNIYDDNGDGFIDRADLVSMLCSVIPDLSKTDALALIESIFDQADADGDRRIDFDDYKQLVMNSHAFYEAFTIDIATVLRQHYGVISDDIIAHRVSKLQERDLRQEERASQVNEKESIFMERDHEEVQIVNDLSELGID